MSAAHLYISVWFQIKFSEVETEELRFGEQCVEDERPMFKCLNNVIRDSLHSKHSTRINPSLCRGLVRALGIEKFREVPLPTLETTNAGGDAKPSLPRKMDITF